MDKNKCSVEIFGVRYALKGSAEEKKMKVMADMLDAQMREVARANPRLPIEKIAVLAALNICDAYIGLEQDYRQLIELIKEE